MLPPRVIRSRYRWNPNAGTTGRYINARGQFVSQAAVIRETENVISGIKGEMQELYRQLQGREISLQNELSLLF